MRTLFLILFLLTSSFAHAEVDFIDESEMTFEEPYSYHYYVGPWIWHDDGSGETYWKPPTGTKSALDLRSISEMSVEGEGGEGLGLFATDTLLDRPYTFLGEGNMSLIPATGKMKTILASICGYTPKGNTLAELVFNLLTEGASVDGRTCPRPIMPDSHGLLKLSLQNHSLVYAEKFEYGTHPHTEKVRDVYRDNYRHIRAAVLAGEASPDLHLKYLGWLGEEYKMRNPSVEFIPDDLPQERAKKPATTLTESFNCADSASLTCDNTWTEVQNGSQSDIASSVVQYTANGSSTITITSRLESDLSGSDQECDVDAPNMFDTTSSNSSYHTSGGCGVRYSSSADTFYYGGFYQAASDTCVFYKVVTGTRTSLGSASCTIGDGDNYKATINGSSYEVFLNSTSKVTGTDSAITSGSRCGLAYMTGKWAGSAKELDALTCADLTTGTSGGDCFDSDTVLMLHMNGSDTSTTFTDDSASSHTATATGDAQIDTAQSKFSGASGLFDGTGDYLSVNDSDDWYFGTGDWTIDFWVRFNSLAANLIIMDHYEDSNNRTRIAWLTSNTLQFLVNDASVSVITFTESWTPSTGTWYHVAIVRSANDHFTFIDGSQVGTEDTDASEVPNHAGTLLIGDIGGGGAALNGWLDEFRIVKGTAVWTSNFTPPSAEYTDGCTAASRRRILLT